MKYLILIHSNPRSRAVWAELTDEQRIAFGGSHMALNEALAASGELVVAEGLADIALAKRVSVRDGATTAYDGPFAEVKEHLAGFYLVDCHSVERAVEIAAATPDARLGGDVEVRPVLDMSTPDL